VYRAIEQIRGEVLVYEDEVCDARYGKCCGGITEDFRVAWGDRKVPYLVPVIDGRSGEMPRPPLSDEDAMREYLHHPPDVFCNCKDPSVLDTILTPRDRETRDFFRWKVVLTAEQAQRLIEEKLGLGLGRIVAMEPVERGLSGRLKRLRLVGESGSIVIGKELEIRRVLSDTHLYSSAFVIDMKGPTGRPDAFVLSGAGWGHGVGLCQIGAAVMAWHGTDYEEILNHYYPGTVLERAYE
jgi:peptidoglycan hydrolase-like amidase